MIDDRYMTRSGRECIVFPAVSLRGLLQNRSLFFRGGEERWEQIEKVGKNEKNLLTNKKNDGIINLAVEETP